MPEITLWDGTPITADHFRIFDDHRKLDCYDRKSIRVAENACVGPGANLVLAQKGRIAWKALGMKDGTAACRMLMDVRFEQKYRTYRRHEPQWLTAVIDFWPTREDAYLIKRAGADVLFVKGHPKEEGRIRTEAQTIKGWVGEHMATPHRIYKDGHPTEFVKDGTQERALLYTPFRR